MRLRFAIALLLVIGAAQVAAATHWRPSLGSTLSEARKSGKLVMLLFYTGWSGWSQRMLDETFAHPDMTKVESQFIPVRVKVEGKGRDTAATYNVMSYPTVLFLDARGEVVGKLEGYAMISQLRERADQIRRVVLQLPAIGERLRKNPRDGAALATLACFHAWKGSMSQAQDALSRAEKLHYSGPEIATAFNAVADGYQAALQFHRAIALFHRADALAKDQRTKGYALMSIMYCYIGLRDMKSAVPYAHKVLALKGIDREWVDGARGIINRASLNRPVN